MEDAIERLEALKAEYEAALNVPYESKDYYATLRIRVDTIEEAIARLRA